VKRGEVWKVRLPPADGHTQAGARPAVIVQKDAHIAVLPTVLIVPLTGNLAAGRFAGTTTLPPDPQNGLTIPSVALVFQLRALDKRDFLQRLGALDSASLGTILTVLADLTA
jgi:mRNA interferase MazF